MACSRQSLLGNFHPKEFSRRAVSAPYGSTLTPRWLSQRKSEPKGAVSHEGR